MRRFKADAELYVIISEAMSPELIRKDTELIRKDTINVSIEGNLQTDMYRFNYEIKNDYLNKKIIEKIPEKLIELPDSFCRYCSKSSFVNQDPTDIKNLLQYAYNIIMNFYYDPCYPDYNIGIGIIKPGNIIPVNRVFKGKIKVNSIIYPVEIIFDSSDYTDVETYDIKVSISDRTFEVYHKLVLLERDITSYLLANIAYKAYMDLVIRDEDMDIYGLYNMNIVTDFREEK